MVGVGSRNGRGRGADRSGADHRGRRGRSPSRRRPRSRARPPAPRRIARSPPARHVPGSGGGLALTGTGFDPAVDLYLAVCQAGITPADPLTYCIGGQVPDDNDTKAWAVVTEDTNGKANAVAFAADGSFDAGLTLATPTGSSVDCVASAA